MPLILVVADGARPDTLAARLDAGALPAMARLRAEGALHTVTSVFPSTTGPAYTPFLLGRFPGPVGLPGIRWFDRARARTVARGLGPIGALAVRSRSYVGYESRRINHDLDGAAPTVFELVGGSLSAFNNLDRGVRPRDRIGAGAAFTCRIARAHFAGDLRRWLDIDRAIARRFAERVHATRPALAFCALNGIDKTSHAAGQDSPAACEAMGIVDDLVARLRADAERAGRWDDTHLWVVSDHGHSPVHAHDDLARRLGEWGYRVLAHPWTWGRMRVDVAVMVSGNAMAHLYVDPAATERPWRRGVLPRWAPLIGHLLAQPSVDLMLVPHSPTRCEIRTRDRGTAIVERTGDRYRYRPRGGDPLGLGAHAGLTADEALDLTRESDYPDAIVQIVQLAGSRRAGDIILSATRGWDFRARYEPIPHVSAHGALHREHMLVPLLLNRPAPSVPRRTTDVMPSVLQALGHPVPRGLDGTSFLHAAGGGTAAHDAAVGSRSA